MRARAKAIATFLAVTCGFSWALLAIFHLRGGGPEGLLATVVLPYSLGPLMGALFLQWRRNEKAMTLLGGDPFPNLWFLAAWAIPPAVVLAALGLSALVPHAYPSFSGLAHLEAMRSHLSAKTYASSKKDLQHVPAILAFGAFFVPAVFYGATVVAVVALGEEIGWRVTLLRELAPLGFWPTALILGVARAAWITPLVVAGFPYPAPLIPRVLVIAGFSLVVGVLATFLRVKGGSVLPSALFIGELSATSNLLTLYVIGGSRMATGAFGVVELAVLAVATAVVVFPRAPGKSAVAQLAVAPADSP